MGTTGDADPTGDGAVVCPGRCLDPAAEGADVVCKPPAGKLSNTGERRPTGGVRVPGPGSRVPGPESVRPTPLVSFVRVYPFVCTVRQNVG